MRLDASFELGALPLTINAMTLSPQVGENFTRCKKRVAHKRFISKIQ